NIIRDVAVTVRLTAQQPASLVIEELLQPVLAPRFIRTATKRAPLGTRVAQYGAPTTEAGTMDAANDAVLLRAIEELRAQLAFLPLNDPRRGRLYRDLLWCYHQTFALIYQRIKTLQAERTGQNTNTGSY